MVAIGFYQASGNIKTAIAPTIQAFLIRSWISAKQEAAAELSNSLSRKRGNRETIPIMLVNASSFYTQFCSLSFHAIPTAFTYMIKLVKKGETNECKKSSTFSLKERQKQECDSQLSGSKVR